MLLLDGSAVAWPSGTTATNPGGSNPGSETPSKTIDGSLSTKWLDWNFNADGGDGQTGSSALVIDTGASNTVTFDGYKWSTANDESARDPVTWKVYGSSNSTTWILLDSRADQSITETRQTYTSNYSVTDVSIPAVSTLSPADNATSVSTTANLVITFDEVTRAGTGTLTIKKSSDDSTVETITVSGALLSGNGSTELTLNPSTTLTESTSYYVVWTANAFKDPSGNHAAVVTATTTWNFTTGDFTAPTVSSLSPADNAYGIAVDTNLVIVFSEVVQGGTGSIFIRKSPSNAVAETIAASASIVSGSGSTTVTINPSITLDYSTIYYILIGANAFRDGTGNHYAGISDPPAWNVTTLDTPVSTSGGGGGGGAGGGRRDSLMRLLVLQAQQSLLARYRDAFVVGTQSSSSAPQKVVVILESSDSDTPPAEKESGPVLTMPSTVSKPEASKQSSFPRRSLTVLAERRGKLLVMVGDVAVLYRDVGTDSWFAPYVAELATNGIAEGYRDEQGNPTGEFGVTNRVTKGELLKMALGAGGKSPDVTTKTAPQNRTARGTWAAPYVKLAEDMNLTICRTNPDVTGSASRGEVIQTILEVMGIPTAIKLSSPFTDVPDTHPFAKAITTASAFGLVEGDMDTQGQPLNRFRPDDPINRAEVAKFIALAREITGQSEE